MSDERARSLNNQARKAIVSFIDLRRGGSEVKRKIILPNPMHPSLFKSMKIVEDYFPDIMLCDQNLLAETASSKLFSFVSDSTYLCVD